MKVGLKFSFVLVLVSGLFLTGFAWRDIAARKLPSGPAFSKLFGQPSVESKTPAEVFRDNFSLIATRSYRAVPEEKLKFRAMEGMFSALGDPHTNYLEPKAAEDLKLETRGDFVGIGCRLSPDPLGAKVAVVFDGSPAQKAGLLAGDTIVAVHNESTSGLDVDTIVNSIRGKEGSSVKLKVLRQGSLRPIELSITRAIVVIPTAEGKMLPGGYAYVSVSQFAETTTSQFKETMKKLLANNPKGLVIDLRGNPGGLLDTARDMLGLFVENKTVVKMKFRGGFEEQAVTPGGQTLGINVPVSILVNEDSASAAEIFAGVMRDYQLATLVGSHTYGKASVQKVFTLLDLASAKITIAKYYLPSGDDISRKVDEDGEYISGGIKPEIEVPFKTDKDALFADPVRDSQLAAALQMLQRKTLKAAN